MDIAEIRRVNLQKLFDKFRDKTPGPDRGKLKMFGAQINVSPRHVSHLLGGRRNIGEKLAREIEIAAGLDRWHLDKQESTIEPRTVDEREFVETALALFRDAPDDARKAMLDAIRKRLIGKQ